MDENEVLWEELTADLREDGDQLQVIKGNSEGGKSLEASGNDKPARSDKFSSFSHLVSVPRGAVQ